ncbi:hypothetical protein OK351_05690 [Glutamicibacter sp. MNS18]|uniref:hypothetical protein n=1 Tax=Glutamicibacter sp. MNS18 TaxID=2989817 RepID=UPI0022354BC6|nr:hypothetical protein [Glutamicibacter sp. MNS18]MCW4464994.1 hypothetical protein [Glutamicibacter sp. MNS18]
MPEPAPRRALLVTVTGVAKNMSMCNFVLWAVNAHAFDQEFIDATTGQLGVAPEPSDISLKSSRVRAGARYFTLTPNMCNCGTLMGLGDSGQPSDGIETQALLGWIARMPEFAPRISRLALYNAWSPEDDQITPGRAKGIQVAQLDELLLRRLPEDMLLTIDYPARY